MLRAMLLLSVVVFAPILARADDLPAEVACVRVVDGDTIVCEGDDGKRFVVRLLGVDTPETKHPRKPVQPFGPEASAYVKGRLVGEDVRLVADTVSKPTDRYGRRLAWVFLGDDLVNETLVREGYGRAYTEFAVDPILEVKLRLLERSAREAKRGLWGLDEPQ